VKTMQNNKLGVACYLAGILFPIIFLRAVQIKQICPIPFLSVDLIFHNLWCLEVDRGCCSLTRTLDCELAGPCVSCPLDSPDDHGVSRTDIQAAPDWRYCRASLGRCRSGLSTHDFRQKQIGVRSLCRKLTIGHNVKSPYSVNYQGFAEPGPAESMLQTLSVSRHKKYLL
jgi:hypothetical protein